MSKFDLSGESFGMSRNARGASESDSKQGAKSVVSSVSGIVTDSRIVSERQKGHQEPFQGRVGVHNGVDAKPSQRAFSGPKMQITSIRFTPENHYYVRQEASMRGMTVIDFVNWVIDQYKSDPRNVHSSGVYKDSDKW